MAKYIYSFEKNSNNTPGSGPLPITKAVDVRNVPHRNGKRTPTITVFNKITHLVPYQSQDFIHDTLYR